MATLNYVLLRLKGLIRGAHLPRTVCITLENPAHRVNCGGIIINFGYPRCVDYSGLLAASLHLVVTLPPASITLRWEVLSFFIVIGPLCKVGPR